MKVSKPQIIGILLNYRDATRSLRCVRSLLDEGVDGVVLWDNSADHGASASSISASIDDRVELFVSEQNLGFAAGMNAALSIMQNRWAGASALLINNDATLRKGALAAMSALADAGTIVAPVIDHSGDVVEFRYSHRWLGIQTKRPFPGAFPFASGACLLLPPSISHAPLFDEAFFMYGEDVDLGWRLCVTKRWSIKLTEKPQVDHEVGASSGKGSMFYETQMAAAHWLLADRLAKGSIDRCLLHASRGAYLVVRAVIRSVRSKSLVPWRGLASGIRQARAISRGEVGTGWQAILRQP
ncbi:glycosyltransferase [Luteibacter yeojuensis]|uniref:Glycosyltransferase n=1 Tax=Luteibacter yeojuensis TaxID=345309 RepID=A0A7X5QWK5_9GAMM|nr:glycosyltransferase [Luteibacter yeojuensis]